MWHAPDAPALGRHDGGKQAQRIAAVPRHEAVDPVKEERLPARGDLGLAPDRPVEPEVLHSRRTRERVEPRLADEPNHSRRGCIVRPPDHRSEQVALPLLQRPIPDVLPAKVGDQEHRLEHARGGSDLAGVVAVQPSGFVHYGERDRPCAPFGVAFGRCHAGLPGRRRGGVSRGCRAQAQDDEKPGGNAARVNHCRRSR
jgi:hypothetical protein